MSYPDRSAGLGCATRPVHNCDPLDSRSHALPRQEHNRPIQPLTVDYTGIWYAAAGIAFVCTLILFFRFREEPEAEQQSSAE